MRTTSMLVLALAAACGSEKKPDPEPAQGSDTKPAPAADLPPANSGLLAKDNDPAVVALSRAALVCKVDDKQLDYFCAGYTAWRDSALLTDNKADKTLVNLLEDRDEKVRYLAAEKLTGIHTGYAQDPVAAKRVLAAAQRETSVLVAERLGKALGFVDVEKTGITADVRKLIVEHKLVDLRIGLIAEGAHSNSDALFDVVFELATGSTDDKIRLKAVTAFWVGTPSSKRNDVCKMWLDTVDHTNAEIAGEAAYMCGLNSSCTAQWDKLLDKLDARAKRGTVSHRQMTAALEWQAKQKEATAPQKARALAIAKAVVENPKNASDARAHAIDVVAALDKADKAFPAKFKDDPDASVKAAVERALK
jgi:hypothetical protein